MNVPLRIGTRKSKLALRQTALVREQLRQRAIGTELVEITTDGDVDGTTPLPAFGSRGVFTDALERALLDGHIDAAVHSLKDLPVEPSPDLVVAAICLREDPRDVLVASGPARIESLRHGARVGTCSLRRSAQLRAVRPDLVMVPLRGNVDTRIRRILAGDYDAIVLAAAGVHRLSLSRHISQYFPLEQVLPAPGQGALALQCRASDTRAAGALALLDDSRVRPAVEAERTFLATLGGGCGAPVAACAETLFDGSRPRLRLRGWAATADCSRAARVAGEAPLAEARSLAVTLAQDAARELAESGVA